MVSPNFAAIISEGTDVVDGLDTLVEGVVTQDRQVAGSLLAFFFPLVEAFRNIAAHKESQGKTLVHVLSCGCIDIDNLSHVHVVGTGVVRNSLS